jgi:hypothetical protein
MDEVHIKPDRNSELEHLISLKVGGCLAGIPPINSVHPKIPSFDRTFITHAHIVSLMYFDLARCLSFHSTRLHAC